MSLICAEMDDLNTVDDASTVTQINMTAAKYKVNYYLQNDEGEFVLDEDKSVEKSAPVGKKVIISRDGITGYHLLTTDSRNVFSGIVTDIIGSGVYFYDRSQRTV